MNYTALIIALVLVGRFLWLAIRHEEKLFWILVIAGITAAAACLYRALGLVLS